MKKNIEKKFDFFSLRHTPASLEFPQKNSAHSVHLFGQLYYYIDNVCFNNRSIKLELILKFFRIFSNYLQILYREVKGILLYRLVEGTRGSVTFLIFAKK